MVEIQRARFERAGDRIILDVGVVGDRLGQAASPEQHAIAWHVAGSAGAGDFDLAGDLRVGADQDDALLAEIRQHQVARRLVAGQRRDRHVVHLDGVGRAGRHRVGAIGDFDLRQDGELAVKRGAMATCLSQPDVRRQFHRPAWRPACSAAGGVAAWPLPPDW
jgi:hypothetical protein